MVGSFLKVGPDTIGQDRGFPDIEDVTIGILEEIHPGIRRKVIELDCKSVWTASPITPFYGAETGRARQGGTELPE